MKNKYGRDKLVEELERMTPGEQEKPIIVKMGDKTSVTGKELLDQLKGKKKLSNPYTSLGSKKSLLRKLDQIIK